MLVVEVHGHRCGLPAAGVVELLPMVATTVIPGAPAVVEGIVDVRGTIVPVLDLRARFGLEQRRPQPNDRLVLIRTEQRVVALHVDRVVDLADGEAGDVIALTDALGDGAAQHLAGVGRRADGLLLILDVDAFLSDDEAADLEAALAVLHGAQDDRR